MSAHCTTRPETLMRGEAVNQDNEAVAAKVCAKAQEAADPHAEVEILRYAA